MQCSANKDTLDGTSEMFTLCQCEDNVWVWYAISVADVGVEIIAWKPWKRLGSVCSSISWGVGLALVLQVLLTAVVLVVFALLSSGAASLAYYLGSGYIESEVDATIIWFNCVAATLAMLNQSIQWHSALDAAATYIRDLGINNNEEEEEEPANIPRARPTLRKRMTGVNLSLKSKLEVFVLWLKAHFGPYVFHLELVSLELVEVVLQLQFMFSVLSLVPYNEWLMVMIWLDVSLLCTVLVVAVPCIREQPWSLKLMYAIEGMSDLIYLWFNLYSLQYLTARSTLGNASTLPAVTQVLFKLQLGILHSRGIWDTVPMYLTMVRLGYLARTLLDYVIEEMMHVPEVEQAVANRRRRHSSVFDRHAAAAAAAVVDEVEGVGVLVDEDRNAPRAGESSCCKWMSGAGYLFAVMVALVTVGSMLIFVPQYFEIRDECLTAWGDASEWCSVKVYHSGGFFKKPTCGCRVITVPGCGNGLNKTLPSAVFETLGSDVTIAVYGGYCNLIGPIPDEIGNLSNLEFVLLSSNSLNGTLPASIGQLQALEFFQVGRNQLTGEIPASLGNLKRIDFLDLSHNALEGGIPDELQFSMVTDGRPRVFAFGNNNLSGNLTLNFGKHCTSLSNLAVQARPSSVFSNPPT